MNIESTSSESKTVENTATATDPKEEIKSTLAQAEPDKDADDLEDLDGDAEPKDKDPANDDDGDSKPKKKSGSQRLKHRLQLEQQEKEYWKEQALGASKSKEAAKPESKATEKPKAGDFDTHEEFVEALTDWKYDQRKVADSQAEKATKVKTEYESRQKSFQTEIQTFKKSNPDFDDALEDIMDIPMSIAVEDLLLEAGKDGPALLYHLAKNPEEYERICALSPLAAAREFGKFEAKVFKDESNPKPEVKKTNASPPITPVSGRKVGFAKSIHDPNISFAEYEKSRREGMRKKA